MCIYILPGIHLCICNYDSISVAIIDMFKSRCPCTVCCPYHLSCLSLSTNGCSLVTADRRLGSDLSNKVSTES